MWTISSTRNKVKTQDITLREIHKVLESLAQVLKSDSQKTNHIFEEFFRMLKPPEQDPYKFMDSKLYFPHIQLKRNLKLATRILIEDKKKRMEYWEKVKLELIKTKSTKGEIDSFKEKRKIVENELLALKSIKNRYENYHNLKHEVVFGTFSSRYAQQKSNSELADAINAYNDSFQEKVSLPNISKRKGKSNNKDEYMNALDNFTKSKKLNEEIFGTLHPRVADNRYHIGMIYKGLNNEDFALTNLKGTKKIDVKRFGKDHEIVVLDMLTIASINVTFGNYSQAISNHEEALNLMEKFKIGDEIGRNERDKNFGIVCFFMGQLWEETSNFKESNNFYQRASTIFEKTNNQNHKEVVFTKIIKNLINMKTNENEIRSLIYAEKLISNTLRDKLLAKLKNYELTLKEETEVEKISDRFSSSKQLQKTGEFEEMVDSFQKGKIRFNTTPRDGRVYFTHAISTAHQIFYKISDYSHSEIFNVKEMLYEMAELLTEAFPIDAKSTMEILDLSLSEEESEEEKLSDRRVKILKLLGNGLERNSHFEEASNIYEDLVEIYKIRLAANNKGGSEIGKKVNSLLTKDKKEMADIFHRLGDTNYKRVKRINYSSNMSRKELRTILLKISHDYKEADKYYENVVPEKLKKKLAQIHVELDKIL